MTAFPTHMFKVPGPYRKGRQTYALIGAVDEEQFAERLANGWHGSLEDAVAAQNADRVVEAAAALDEATRDMDPPTRDELEAKARELEIGFDGRTSDKVLADRIARKLEE